MGEWDASVDKLAAGFLKLLEIIDRTQVFLWRVLEIHIIKFICPVVIWFTLQEVSGDRAAPHWALPGGRVLDPPYHAPVLRGPQMVLPTLPQVSLMNSLFYISWVVAIPYSSLRPHASHFSTVWACVIVICKMLYQLKSVVPASYSSNCTQVGVGRSDGGSWQSSVAPRYGRFLQTPLAQGPEPCPGPAQDGKGTSSTFMASTRGHCKAQGGECHLLSPSVTRQTLA